MLRLSFFIVVLVLGFEPSVVVASEELEDQKRRLLDRIIATEDEQVRTRLLKIYESLEDSSHTRATPKKQLVSQDDVQLFAK